jgi:hypothetical protein
MSAWTVVPCLLALRDEFDYLNPDRDKGADGTISDANHSPSSDHSPDEDSDVLRDHDADDKNEVHALDIDSTGPWPNVSFHTIVMKVIEWEKKKWNDPNDKCRLNYVIWDHKIYDKDNDFVGVAYGGSDPHTNHAHFSSRYETSCENDTRPWGVKATFGDDVTKEEFMAWSKEFHAKTNEGFATNMADGIGGAGPAYSVLSTTAGRTKVALDELNSLEAKVIQLDGVLTSIKATVEATKIAIDAHIAGLVEGTPGA